MKVHEIKHPLVQHKLSLLRHADIDTKSFRELTRELANLLTYEATADLELEDITIKCWSGENISVKMLHGKKLTVVPILRAGLGMMDGVLESIPAAKVSMVGMYRNEETAEPVPYFSKLCADLPERMALVIDPMLATGGTMVETINLLKEKGCKSIRILTLVSAPEGIKLLAEAHPDVVLYTGSIDQCLNEDNYIIPGLGDAGDKIFGTK